MGSRGAETAERKIETRDEMFSRIRSLLDGEREEGTRSRTSPSGGEPGPPFCAAPLGGEALRLPAPFSSPSRQTFQSCDSPIKTALRQLAERNRIQLFGFTSCRTRKQPTFWISKLPERSASCQSRANPAFWIYKLPSARATNFLDFLVVGALGKLPERPATSFSLRQVVGALANELFAPAS